MRRIRGAQRVASKRVPHDGQKQFGTSLVTIVLLVSLVASASAMSIAGPRVYYALGRDFSFFSFLSRTTASTGAPMTALLVQGLVTSVILLLGRVDQIQQYSGFTLTLFASLAVSCVIVRRIRWPDMVRPFEVFAYPLTPLLFLGVSAWMMYWAVQGRPLESMLALGTVAIGGLLFVVTSRSKGSREVE